MATVFAQIAGFIEKLLFAILFGQSCACKLANDATKTTKRKTACRLKKRQVLNLFTQGLVNLIDCALGLQIIVAIIFQTVQTAVKAILLNK